MEPGVCGARQQGAVGVTQAVVRKIKSSPRFIQVGSAWLLEPIEAEHLVRGEVRDSESEEEELGCGPP